MSILQNSIALIFNPEHNFYEIKNCSRKTQLQAFNLFNEYYYHQITNTSLNNTTFHYINQIIELEETILKNTSKDDLRQMDFGRKGLIKSELYKYHNYKIAQKTL